VVPRTTTLSPAVTSLAAAEVVPSKYFVPDDSVIVTFWPADVATVKPDADTLATVPDVPPAAGRDRAFDPLPGPEPAAADPVAGAAEPLLAIAELAPESALTIPYELPPSARAAAPAIIDLVTFRLDIASPFPLVATPGKLPTDARAALPFAWKVAAQSLGAG
jgi:hypothetical protein